MQSGSRASIVERLPQHQRARNARDNGFAQGEYLDFSDVWQALRRCNSLGCSFEELRAAIRLKGTRASAVRAWLQDR